MTGKDGVGAGAAAHPTLRGQEVLMTTSFVDVPGGRLFVVDEGAGSPIVLLHAGIADIRSWNEMVPLLNAAGYRTIRYDQRGTGGSTTEDVAFSRVADLLAVLDASGVDRVVLVGNSMGGVLAFDTAIEAPDRVVAIVGVAAGLGGFDGGNTPEELAMFNDMERLEAQDPVDPSAVADIDIAVWVDGPGQPPTRVPAAIRDLVLEMDLFDPSRPQGRPIRLDPPANERLAELRCPILAVAGAIDVSEVAVTARHLESTAPNARALIWPDVAHMIGMEQPQRLSAAIVDFLAPL
ncbi:MAG: alpha/beta hydrolase, partial [Chloroflexota bacterium]